MTTTRRQWVSKLAVGAVGVAARAQQAPETPDELRKAAAERLRRNAEALAKVPVPMATEPAFLFKAE